MLIAERIRSLRTQQGISQQELAKIVGKTQQAVNLWEKGENAPGLETIDLLANYFSVSTDYLLGRTNDPAPRDGGQHINDDEALEYLDELHKRPEMKTLFQVGRKATGPTLTYTHLVAN